MPVLLCSPVKPHHKETNQTMQSLKCPKCSLVNFSNAEICKRCGENMPPPAFFKPACPPPMLQGEQIIAANQSVTDAPQIGDKPLSKVSRGDVLNILVWSGAMIFIGIILLSISRDVSRAESAPQQAATGGINACYAIIVYALARGASEIIKTSQGK